jgi:GT2 family glycosyltransferase
VLYPSTDYWTLADNIAMYHEFSPLSPPGRRTFLATNNLSTARQVAALAGGQDESLLRGQDLDWTIRMRLAGVELYFDPTIRVWHEPHRSGARSMLRRWLRSGHYMLRVRRRYPEAFGTPAWLYHRWAVVGLAPLIALWSTARVFRPGSIGARYLRTLPAVYITRLAWCLGAATVVSEP